MMSSRTTLLIGVLALVLCVCAVSAQGQVRQTTRPAASTARAGTGASTQVPVTRTVPVGGAGAGAGQSTNNMAAGGGAAAGGVSAAGGPGGGRRNNGGHNNHEEEEEERRLEFTTRDLAGSFGLGARGSVIIPNPQLTPPPTPGDVLKFPPLVANVAITGRVCSDQNGTCALHLFVNVQGLRTFEVESGPAEADCEFDIDRDSGEGTITATNLVVANPPTNIATLFPKTIVARVTFTTEDTAFFILEGCGTAGLRQTAPGPINAFGVPVCEDINRIPIEAAGFARRQEMFCDCGESGFSGFNGDDNDDCPAANRFRKDKDDNKDKDNHDHDDH